MEPTWKSIPYGKPMANQLFNLHQVVNYPGKIASTVGVTLAFAEFTEPLMIPPDAETTFTSASAATAELIDRPLPTVT